MDLLRQATDDLFQAGRSVRRSAIYCGREVAPPPPPQAWARFGHGSVAFTLSQYAYSQRIKV